MTVQVACPNPSCGAAASVGEESIGRRLRCRRCGEVFPIAQPAGEAAPPTIAEPASPVAAARLHQTTGGSRPASFQLPETFGRYRIVRELGRGGMGAVYLAHDAKLDRRVALKVPFFHPDDGPDALIRFEREAKAAAVLDHPSLCPVHDVGEIDGIPYLTMPFIDGKPLSAAIAKGQTHSPVGAVAVVRKLALAVQAAHDQGVTHRDLKPGNILINKHRDLVIMDFGLARRDAHDDSPLTREGATLGTALYMAPEQAAGINSAIGPRCDIYSLGVILHELLTGARPFEGPWSLVIGLKSVKDPDSLARLRPDIPPALDAICLRAIARKPEDRYASMTEFAEALGQFLADPLNKVPATAATGSGSATPEKLENQFVAGLVSAEFFSLRDESRAAKSPRSAAAGPGQTPTSSRKLVGALVGGAVAIVAAIVALGISLRPRGRDQPPVVVAVPPPAVRSAPIPPTADETDWVSLFNNKDLTGWKPSPGGKNAMGQAGWRVVDGVLTGSGPAPGFLYSEREDFKDFHLRVEARFDGARGGGIGFGTASTTPVTLGKHQQAAEYEVLINSDRADKGGTGGLAMGSPTQIWGRGKEGRIEAGRWFTLDLIVAGPRSVVLIDGALKATHLDRGSARSGHLALHRPAHGTIEFRTIAVENLSDSDRPDAHEIRRFTGHTYRVNKAIFGAAERTILSGGDSVNYTMLDTGGWHYLYGPDNTVRLWDGESGRGLLTMGGGKIQRVEALAVATDGRYAASCADTPTEMTGSVIVWDLKSGGELRRLIVQGDKVPDRWLGAVSFADDDQLILAARSNGTVLAWDRGTGAALAPIELKGRAFGVEEFRAVAFAPGSGHLISGSRTGAVDVWDLRTGETLRTFLGHTGPVVGVAGSEAGRVVLSIGEDNTLRAWDRDTGKPLWSKQPLGGRLGCVAISPDGRRGVSAGTDGVVSVWSVADGQELARLHGHHMPVTSVSLSRDGTRALSSSIDGTVRLWQIP